ncbi:hypothetical protein P4B35_23475 [Pontiellaceae bacterium B12227]|nr:hypothetical protein [Pontiellaceae bacterium B12227]
MKIMIYSILSVVILVTFGCSTFKQTDPSSPLDRFLSQLLSTPKFNVWTHELSDPITDDSIKTNLVEWIQARSFEYDDKYTKWLRESNGGLACISVEIVLPNRESIMIADELLLIGDPVTAYTTSRKCCEFNLDEVLFITGIMEEPYSLALSRDEALVLSEFINTSSNLVIRKVVNTINDQIAGPLYKDIFTEAELEIELESAEKRILEK